MARSPPLKNNSQLLEDLKARGGVDKLLYPMYWPLDSHGNILPPSQDAKLREHLEEAYASLNQFPDDWLRLAFRRVILHRTRDTSAINQHISHLTHMDIDHVVEHMNTGIRLRNLDFSVDNYEEEHVGKTDEEEVASFAPEPSSKAVVTADTASAQAATKTIDAADGSSSTSHATPTATAPWLAERENLRKLDARGGVNKLVDIENWPRGADGRAVAPSADPAYVQWLLELHKFVNHWKNAQLRQAISEVIKHRQSSSNAENQHEMSLTPSDFGACLQYIVHGEPLENLKFSVSSDPHDHAVLNLDKPVEVSVGRWKTVGEIVTGSTSSSALQSLVDTRDRDVNLDSGHTEHDGQDEPTEMSTDTTITAGGQLFNQQRTFGHFRHGPEMNDSENEDEKEEAFERLAQSDLQPSDNYARALQDDPIHLANQNRILVLELRSRRTDSQVGRGSFVEPGSQTPAVIPSANSTTPQHGSISVGPYGTVQKALASASAEAVASSAKKHLASSSDNVVKPKAPLSSPFSTGNDVSTSAISSASTTGERSLANTTSDANNSSELSEAGESSSALIGASAASDIKNASVVSGGAASTATTSHALTVQRHRRVLKTQSLKLRRIEQEHKYAGLLSIASAAAPSKHRRSTPLLRKAVDNPLRKKLFDDVAPGSANLSGMQLKLIAKACKKSKATQQIMRCLKDEWREIRDPLPFERTAFCILSQELEKRSARVDAHAKLARQHEVGGHTASGRPLLFALNLRKLPKIQHAKIVYTVTPRASSTKSSIHFPRGSLAARLLDAAPGVDKGIFRSEVVASAKTFNKILREIGYHGPQIKDFKAVFPQIGLTPIWSDGKSRSAHGLLREIGFGSTKDIKKWLVDGPPISAIEDYIDAMYYTRKNPPHGEANYLIKKYNLTRSLRTSPAMEPDLEEGLLTGLPEVEVKLLDIKSLELNRISHARHGSISDYRTPLAKKITKAFREMEKAAKLVEIPANEYITQPASFEQALQDFAAVQLFPVKKRSEAKGHRCMRKALVYFFTAIDQYCAIKPEESLMPKFEIFGLVFEEEKGAFRIVLW